MDIFGAAKTIFKATKDDAAAVTKIRAEWKDLALAIATDPSASQTVTSATVNGQTFTAGQTMTQGNRLRLLGLVVAMYDQGGTISRVSKPFF
jgi:hypothetical protein